MTYDGLLPGPRVLAYNLASNSYDYMMRVVSLGVFEGPVGDMRIPPQVQAVLDALHTVLAGGEVKIDTVHRGNPDIVRDLGDRIRRATEESNDINKRAGYYFTITA